jgi:hypothetical protein
MRAITVQQPWAWCIFHGKDVENRTRLGTWTPAIGERIAIHAGKRWSARGAVSALVEKALQAMTGSHIAIEGMFTKGAIIGMVDVVDVHPAHGDCCQPWGETSYVARGGDERTEIVHLVLENPRQCEPIECRGALGLWTVPEWAAHMLEEVRA